MALEFRTQLTNLTGRTLCWIALGAVLAVSGCGSQAPQARRFQLKGTVVQVDKSQNHLVVDHEEIKGFMGAMTMPYPIADPKDLDRLSPGDQITADVVASTTEIHLENIVVVKKSDGKTPPPGARLQPSNQGPPVPDFTLVNQDGKRIRVQQYRGKSVLLTFIYTRCPLPDYCPLMSHNFAEIEKALAKSPDLYAKTRLLSISFDSQFDTPEILRKYARQFVSDRGPRTYEHWEFATIPAAEKADVTKFFDVFISGQEGQITHSMSTAIISPGGRVYKTYSSNDWKPTDALTDLTASVSADSTDKITQSFSR
jgi:protein SCO1/2